MKTRFQSSVVALALAVATFPLLAQDAPPPKWETSAAAGLTITSGNSETVVASGNIQTARKWEKSDFGTGADLAYGKDRGTKNTELFRAYGQYNQNLNPRLYLGLRLEGLHDGVADVDYRFTISPLVGYYLVKNEKWFLRLEAGPSGVIEKVASVKNEYLSLRVAERLEWKINERAKLWQALEVLPQIDRWGNTLVNYELGIDTSITTKLGLQSKILGTFDNEPAPGLKDNDFRWITGLAYKF